MGFFNPSSNYSFILEYADSGALKNYLKNNFNNKLDFNIKLLFAIQIADAVSCIHQKDIIHNDLHFNNILVHQNNVMLITFGLSCGVVLPRTCFGILITLVDYIINIQIIKRSDKYF
ncbi:unnamed protein product [Rhizophagus irregularis]|uniref:Protein kinase domain-containing protein n=1 Tax=Rhizophagus irregularis TaxID=588596 RepID=A0A916EJS4_9GLOM|nr:unnamed protein product [Rhizophagus irregularis]